MKMLAGLIVVMMLGACGGGDEAPTAAKYVGAWSMDGWSETTCPGAEKIRSMIASDESTFVFEAGVDADLKSVDSETCNMKWDLANKAAILRAGQKCFVVDEESKCTVEFLSGTMSTLDGRTGSYALTGSISCEVFGKGSATCSLAVNANMTRQ